ncbi:MAG: zinc-binding dehydrogenase [Armatimonadia bacterium]|nr:zinc-binding dehydrogenase [Armatimonadia bacterium]
MWAGTSALPCGSTSPRPTMASGTSTRYPSPPTGRSGRSASTPARRRAPSRSTGSGSKAPMARCTRSGISSGSSENRRSGWMKALVTHLRDDGSREKLLVDNWEDPPPIAGDLIKTKTLYSGITNGTERNDLMGGNYAKPDEMLPATWGYQNVGEVVEVGPDVTKVAVGDVVYSSADHTEYAVFPQEWLYVKLPPTVDPTHAALFGMASVAMRTCRHADIRMGERVLVVGAGFIGQLAAQIAANMGGRAAICDLDPGRLTKAMEIGAAEEAIDVSGDAWDDRVPEAAFQVVIDVAGAPGLEDKMIRAAGHRGRIMLIAGRFEVKYTFNEGQGREITFKQNSHFDVTDLENLCRLVATERIVIGPLLRDVLPLDRAKETYDTLRDEPAKLGGTVFEW